jgi:hypothetical protein
MPWWQLGRCHSAASGAKTSSDREQKQQLHQRDLHTADVKRTKVALDDVRMRLVETDRVNLVSPSRGPPGSVISRGARNERPLPAGLRADRFVVTGSRATSGWPAMRPRNNATSTHRG